MSQVIFLELPDPDEVKRQRAIEIIVSIPARCVLTRQIDAAGKRRAFSCRVVKLAPHELVVAAPVKGGLGERVIITLLEFGRVEGTILKTHALGFVMSVNMTDQERDQFCARIDWYEKHKNHDLPDNRRSKRIVPPNPHSIVLLADGTVVGAFVIDVSVSGAAISADVEVDIGEAVAIGKIVGRVVRYLRDGFAIEFAEPQDPRTLENALRVPGAS